MIEHFICANNNEPWNWSNALFRRFDV